MQNLSNHILGSIVTTTEHPSNMFCSARKADYLKPENISGQAQYMRDWNERNMGSKGLFSKRVYSEVGYY